MADFLFTQAQKDALLAEYQSASSQFDQTPAGAGIFTNLYTMTLEYLTDANGDRLTGVDEATFAWIVGAANVNADEGLFATFIRDYTMKQYQLRNGVPSSISMQEASNKVANNVFTDIADRLNDSNSTSHLPGLTDIGKNDASAAASTVFNGNFTPWAGTLLFPYLGVDDYFRNWLLTTEVVVEDGFTRKALTGTYDLVAAVEAGRSASLSSGFSSFSNFIEAVSNYFAMQFGPPIGATDGDQSDLIAASDQFFRDVYGSDVEQSVLPGARLIYSPSSSQFGPYFHIGTAGDDGNIETHDGADDVVHAGTGDDTVIGGVGGGVELIDGGEGRDTVVFSKPTVWYRNVEVEHVQGNASSTVKPFEWRTRVETEMADDVAYLYSVETIKLSIHNDRLRLKEALPDNIDLTIDGGGQEGDWPGGDIIDATAFEGGGVAITVGLDGRGEVSAVQGGGTIKLIGFEKLTFKGTAQMDRVRSLAARSQNIDTGAGDDVIELRGINSIIYAGAGNDVIKRAGAGTKIYGGTGADSVTFSANTLFADADGSDRIHLGGKALSGGLNLGFGDSPYAIGRNAVLYGINTVGELVIRLGKATGYVANYNGGPGVASPTAGIQIGKLTWSTHRLMDPGFPGMTKINDDCFDALDFFWKATLGHARRTGGDPLVLDLDGDGLELLPQAADSPLFDLDGDGFAEPTGWVRPDDGLLARDLDGNGAIDRVEELFGTSTLNGFSVLAPLDENGDGVIDASDSGFAGLVVWRDADGDAVSDAGELTSLTDLGITSIGLTTTTYAEPVLNGGNAVLEVGSFTRADGTTGEIADVEFMLDQFSTVWTGDDTVSAAAAALPDLHGHGELPSLRVAMTLDPTLVDVVTATLPTLNVVDLDALRVAALPILTAWADVDASQGRRDLPLLTHVDTSGATVIDDFGLFDAATGSWRRASGTDVTDAEGLVIADATLEDILAQDPGTSTWRVMTGPELAFMERFLGEELPIDGAVNTDATAMGSIGGVLKVMVDFENLLAVRLAMSGPLAPFFDGIVYDAERDVFHGATDMQLTPLFDNVLAAADGAAGGAVAYLQSWKPIIDVILGDFDRGETHLENTYNFIFGNLVAAHEAVAPSIDIVSAAEALGIPEGLIVTGSGTMTGTADHDIFYMNAGDQIARGGEGADVYVFGEGFGHDTVDDLEAPFTSRGPDMVRFAGIRSDEVTAERVGIDLVLRVVGTDDQVTVLGQFAGRDPALFGGEMSDETGVAEVVFADGVVWNAIDIARAVAAPDAGSDLYVGTNDIDVLDGGAGDDTLTGGDDSDFYVFGIGYGDDVIDDDQTNLLIDGLDYVEFGAGISVDDLIFSRDGASDDLHIGLVGAADTLTILGQFDAFNTLTLGMQWFDRVEAFILDDGSSLDWEDVMTTLVRDVATDGADSIHGFHHRETLDGGAGDDFLSGGDDGDTYIFDRGYGHDTIAEGQIDLLTSTADTVSFGWSLAPSDVVFSRIAGTDDLSISVVDDTAQLTVEGQFSAMYTGVFGKQWFDRVENFVFVDGTVKTWDQLLVQLIADAKTDGADTIEGFDAQDTLDGGAGDDLLIGGNENDVYVFGHGYGADVVEERRDNILSGGFDVISFTADVATGDIVLERGADIDDLVIRLSGTDDGLTIRDTFNPFNDYDAVEEFHFADGTAWTLADVRMMMVADAATAGDDVVEGFATADTLDGGTGDDTLIGHDGSDVYRFDAGHGWDTVVESVTDIGTPSDDRIEFGAGIAAEWVTLTRSGSDLVVTIANSSEGLRIVDQFDGLGYATVESFLFADGTLWTESDLVDRSAAMVGTDGNDTLTGSVADDAMSGLDGDDLLLGDDGADTLSGGRGDDRMEGGYGGDTYRYDIGGGDDTVYDRGYLADVDTDRLELGEGLTAENVTLALGPTDAKSLLLTFDGVVGSIIIADQFDYGSEGIEEIVFGDGTVWTDAEIAANLLTHEGLPVVMGTSAGQAMTGDTGAEALWGRGGDDTLTGNAGGDVYLYALGDGNDQIFEGSKTGTDRLVLTDLLVSDVVAARALDNTYDFSLTVAATGESIRVDNQFLTGSYGLEEIEFSDGTIWDKATIQANAWFRGTGGADSLTGSTSSEDTFVGGPGNDTLTGLGMGDTYLHAAGDGDDLIVEGSKSGTDTLFLIDLDDDDVSLSRTGTNNSDLAVTDDATGEVITVKSHFLGGYYGIEQLSFANGVSWDRTIIQSMLVA